MHFLKSLQGSKSAITMCPVSIATFHTQGPRNQSICLLGQKILATIFVMKAQAENIQYSEVKRQTKNVLNEINKEEAFTQGFKDGRKIKRKISQDLDGLQNLLIKLTVKARSEKAWLLYEFPFSLNPGDKPNDAQA